MEYREEELITDARIVQAGGCIGDMMVKSIVYKPRVYNVYTEVREDNEYELSRAKDMASIELAKIISGGMKYMVSEDKAKGRKEYRLFISVLMEQEKIDFIDKVSEWEKDVRDGELHRITLASACNRYESETLFDMIKRWWKR